MTTPRAGPWTAFDPAAGADFGVKITTPVLAVSPQTVLDSTVVGSSTPRHIGALIANNGTGTFTWSAVSDTSWLTLTPSGGAPGATPDLALDPTGLALGSHRGTVIPNEPPGFNTRTSSSMALSSSGTCSRISDATTQSKVPSAYGNSSASPLTASAVADAGA